jgi:spore germination protein
MDIYIVRPGDTTAMVAEKYGISVERLISDNGLINPSALVPGQALIILYPERTYIVQPGDTIASIAASNKISLWQLLRNNPLLYDRDYIYPGEVLVIEYNTQRELQVNGYTYVFLNRDILTRALPYLTYLSIYNYRIMENATIHNYGDDLDIIRLSKEYDTIPLMMVSAYSPIGELNIEHLYELLLDNEKQDKLIQDILQIVKQKEYLGVNLLVCNMRDYNQHLYLNSFIKLSRVLKNEGYLFMVTISTDYKKDPDNNDEYENIDYNSMSQVVDQIIFLQNIWEKRFEPPSPISDISLINPFIAYVTGSVTPDKVSIGKPLIGFDWALPFVKYVSDVYSLSLDSAIILAYNERATIKLDETSQTPYYTYVKTNERGPENHIVWFIDARSIKALEGVIMDYNLNGTGLWNITSYNQQLFSVINVGFSIKKFSL